MPDPLSGEPPQRLCDLGGLPAQGPDLMSPGLIRPGRRLISGAFAVTSTASVIAGFAWR